MKIYTLFFLWFFLPVYSLSQQFGRIIDGVNKSNNLASSAKIYSASFTAPDTVCVNTPVNITNTSQNASTYYWNFCVADLNQPPVGVNLGNPGGMLSQPVYIDYVFYNNNYYGFLINHYPGKLVRLDFGNSLLNTPTAVDFGNFGGIIPPTWGSEGIQVVYNEGKWYAIVVGGFPPSGSTPRVLKIEFGANLLNPAPVATNWGNLGNMLQPLDLYVFQEGSIWYGLTVNAENNSITRFNFTNSFDNTPTAVNLGGFGLLNYPTGVYAINDNGFWRVFVTNRYNSSRLVRLDFGSSLLNTPTAVDLGSLGGANDSRDITIVKMCDKIVGFAVNGVTNSLYRLNFPNLASAPTITNLGNIGNMNFPVSLAKLFRVNDDLYSFVPNVTNNSITRLRFTGCTSSSPASSALQNPPSVVYNAPGIYNINLTVDDGLPTQSSFCKQVVVLPAPSHSPTQNIPLCNVQSIKIGSAVKPATYLWSTGSTADSIIVNTPGIYWVESNRYGCMVRDSFNVFKNIDSVRIDSNQLSCSSFTFSGLGYTNTNPIASWQWYFGDGGTATTQNANHAYLTPGTFPVKLIVTDINGCKDSITINVTTGTTLGADFSYSIDPCNPLTVQFNSAGAGPVIPDGDFGDGSVWTGQSNPLHTYSTPGNYLVQFYYNNGVCKDTVRKTIQLGVIQDNIILTQDTTICYGATKKLLTVPALGFCWTPATYLDNPNSPQPTTSTPHSITYYYTAAVTGNNVITNGNFSLGNTGFISDYAFANPNTTEGQYTVGANPQAWNGALSPCSDHTTGNGNMMLVNGSPVVDATVWKQTVTVLPNTNYAFSTWIQSVSAPNPAQLQFSINGRNLGNPIIANATACLWAQFYTTWNSGSNTSAVISIVNKNTLASGNDFALDDISFAPVFIKRDSVKITVDTARVRTNNDTTICKATSVQLNSVGGLQYSWTPSTGLSNAAIANPVASPTASTEYIVTGTNSNGCTAKDTVNIYLFPSPSITVSNDTAICKNTTVQLFATGGTGYTWSPSATLSNPAIANPIASPVVNTKYYVMISDINTCTYIDSVQVNIVPSPVFAVNANKQVCLDDSVQLSASGGNVYSWSPAGSLTNSGIANPIAFPTNNTTYTVTILETTCNETTTLTTQVTVVPPPTITASKANDIDCSFDKSQLNATGGSQYTWSPAGTLSSTTISNPVASPITTTEYIVKGTDINGCEAFDSVTVNVENVNKGGYLMPSAFTPNNDGLNDCYRIKFWGIVEELEFSIFNRWGERVFYTTDPTKCWDGTYKGVMQNTAVFVYMIKAKTTCESDVFRKGTLLLIR